MRAPDSRVPAGPREVWEGTFVFRAKSVCSLTMEAQRSGEGKVDAAGVPASRVPARSAAPRRRPPRAGVRPAKKRNLAPLYTSTSQEWYTPACVLDRVIELFGEIDLDPCSNSHERPSVVARCHLTAQNDGLAHRWSGKVFVNPPYCNVEKWVAKVLEEYASGRVTEALLLVPSRTDTKWASLLRDVPRCYVTGRLKFVPGEDVPEEKRRNGATFGSALFYLGPNPGRFTDVFGRGPGCLGDVFVRVP